MSLFFLFKPHILKIKKEKIMKNITREELDEILRKHVRWLCGLPDGVRADLSEANLYKANLLGANLYKANLSGANLSEANLYKANLLGAKGLPAIACPEKGSFIAFKKVRGNYIVELEIPADALRSSATSRKCRCSKAKVLSITNLDGSPAIVDTVFSKHDANFAYTIGETVEVANFDTNRWKECAPGIHFFITRQEAVDYFMF